MDHESNYTTVGELRQIANVLELLNNLPKGMNAVSLGEFNLFDSNGEALGYVGYGEPGYIFFPGVEITITGTKNV